MKKYGLYLVLLLMVVAVVSCDHKSAGYNPSGTATLDWAAPITNSDGSALTDLVGFRVYYGTSSGSHPQSIDVGNVTTYQLTDLPRGVTYYFVVRAYNQAGVESDPSNECSKEIH